MKKNKKKIKQLRIWITEQNGKCQWQTISGSVSGPHKQSILRNKELPKTNAPHKPRDVTRPTVMVKRYGFRGTLSIKYKIDFWNNPITANVLVWNQVVLNQRQQLGYLNSKLMLSWDCPFKEPSMQRTVGKSSTYILCTYLYTMCIPIRARISWFLFPVVKCWCLLFYHTTLSFSGASPLTIR